LQQAYFAVLKALGNATELPPTEGELNPIIKTP
jgi:hypothetical protein